MTFDFEIPEGIAQAAIERARRHRETVHRPQLRDPRVRVYAWPSEEVPELILRVDGRAWGQRVEKDPGMGGLFGGGEETVVEIDLGDDWVLVYAKDVPAGLLAPFLAKYARALYDLT